MIVRWEGQLPSACFPMCLLEKTVSNSNFWGNKHCSVKPSMRHTGSFGLCDYRVACLPDFQLMMTIWNYGWYASDSVQGVDIQVSSLRLWGSTGPSWAYWEESEKGRAETSEWAQRTLEWKGNPKLKQGGGDSVQSRHFWDNCSLWGPTQEHRKCMRRAAERNLYTITQHFLPHSLPLWIDWVWPAAMTRGKERCLEWSLGKGDK